MMRMAMHGINHVDLVKTLNVNILILDIIVLFLKK